MLSTINDDYLQAFPELQVISVFDSVDYENFDFDGLGPSQRSYLIAKVEEIGFRQISGKWLSHENGCKIFFPPVKFFNRNFNSFLIDQNPGDNTWLATTPTQTAYLLFKTNSNDTESIFQLMMKHPFNLDKLLNSCSHESFFSHLLKSEDELRRLQARAKVLLKNKTPLGSLS